MRSQWRECIIRMRFGLLGLTVEAHTHKQRRKKQTAKSYNEMHKATYERYLIHQIKRYLRAHSIHHKICNPTNQ